MQLTLWQRFLFVAAIALVRVTSKKQENRPPNIIVMLMDDCNALPAWRTCTTPAPVLAALYSNCTSMGSTYSTPAVKMGWGDLGCYGNQEKETPNIDRLASQGALFTNFYSANPLCSPSRAALMTGRLPIRNGIYTNNHFGRNSVFFPNVTGGLVDEEETIAEILAKLGYRNKIIGKWHIGNTEESFPLNQGFHEFFGANANHFGPHDDVNAPNVEVYRDNKMVGRYFEREFNINLRTGESNLTRFWTNDALGFIEENKDNPFFLYWAADGTHNPLGAHGDFLRTSKRGLYGDVVRELDYGVGQIINKLKELKLHRNTFVFFSSDNGPAGYEGIESGDSGPFKCSKLTTYEGGFRVPGIAWWPGVIPKRQVERGPATLMDIFNTILDVTGGAVSNSSRQLDGQSLWPVLVDENDVKLGKNTVFYYRGDGLFAVRVADYKAHYWTWNIQKELRDKYGDPCRGDFLENFITDVLTDHRRQPVIFHLGRDPRENYPLDPSTREYTQQLAIINKVRENHIASLTGDVGLPQLNICDKCTMGWSPNGCGEIGMCRTPVDCSPSLCNWFF